MINPVLDLMDTACKYGRAKEAADDEGDDYHGCTVV